MDKIYKIVAVTGEYQDKETGATKKRYLTVGAVFTDKMEDGTTRRSIKLDSLPISATWDGWLQCYPPDDTDRG